MRASGPIAGRNPWWPIAAALAVGAVVYLVALAAFAAQQSLLLGVVAFMVVLWTNEGLALGVVSLLPLILFPAMQIAGMDKVAVNYANPIIFLFLGGFMLAIAVEKTGLHRQIACRLLAIFPDTARGMIFSLALTSGLLSSFLSNTTTALLLMPLALFLTDEARLRVRFALAIAYGASVGGIITPIGTPPNLILLGFMAQKAMLPIPFLEWVGLVLPLAATMFIAMSMLLSAGLGSEVLRVTETPSALDAGQRKVVRVLLALLLLLLINSPMGSYHGGLGLDEKGILLGFGLLMFLPRFGVLQWADSKRIPFEIIFLFGAGFSIAYAFTTTGLADAIGGYLLNVTGMQPWLLIILIAMLVTFATEITSNTALISMMLPVMHAVSTAGGLDTTLFLLVATICASYAFMLPIATPPNAIAIASGVVRPVTMMRFGLLMNLIGIALISLFAQAYWGPALAP